MHAIDKLLAARPPHGRRALLLDLDGVLLDTLPVMRTAWSAVCEHHGVREPFEVYAQHLGRPFEDIMRLLDLPNGERLQATYDRASLSAAHLARPFPGIAETLLALAADDWLLGVVTSKPLRRAAPLLVQLGCPFSTIRTPGLERGKPAPDSLFLAVLDLRVDPSAAVYVGDTGVDQEAARRAGIAYIHASWGFGEAHEPLPAIAKSPQELLRIMTLGGHARLNAENLG
ncbi:HAD family hydrolase [Embleya sp. NPDC055664]